MKSTSPRLHTMMMAMVGALQQGGCASDDGGAGGPGSSEDEVQSPESEPDADDGDAPGDESCRPDACDGATGTGVYIGMRCDGEALFDMAPDLACGDARDRCLGQAGENPGESIYCEWNGIEIFRHEASDLACTAFGPEAERDCQPPPAPSCEHPCTSSGLGRYRGFACHGADHPFILTEAIDCQAALGNCLLNAALNPDLSIYCEWNGEEIYRSEVVPGACRASHGPPQLDCSAPRPDLCHGDPCVGDDKGTYSGSFCEGSEFIRTENIHCQAALGNCALNTMLNPEESIRCEWNGEEVYRREVEAGSCDAYGPSCAR